MRHSQCRIKRPGLFCPVNSLIGQLSGRSTLLFYGLIFYCILCMLIMLLLLDGFGFLKHSFHKTSWFWGFFAPKVVVNRVLLLLTDCLTLQVITACSYILCLTPSWAGGELVIVHEWQLWSSSQPGAKALHRSFALLKALEALIMCDSSFHFQVFFNKIETWKCYYIWFVRSLLLERDSRN